MSNEIREVVSAPPDEPPNLYWMSGHVPAEKFMEMFSVIDRDKATLQPSNIKHGWGSRKMSGITVYLSDVSQENFEPITYWIPDDAA